MKTNNIIQKHTFQKRSKLICFVRFFAVGLFSSSCLKYVKNSSNTYLYFTSSHGLSTWSMWRSSCIFMRLLRSYTFLFVLSLDSIFTFFFENFENFENFEKADTHATKCEKTSCVFDFKTFGISILRFLLVKKRMFFPDNYSEHFKNLFIG